MFSYYVGFSNLPLIISIADVTILRVGMVLVSRTLRGSKAGCFAGGPFISVWSNV